MKKIIIIGGGLGGLSAGITLRSVAIVIILDENSHPGGKMMPVKMDGYSFDFGPNTITMPEVFNSVINNAGGNASSYFQFKKIVKHTENVFSNGDVLFQSIRPR